MEESASLAESTRQIELSGKIHFPTGSDVIETRSYGLLDEVAEILMQNPQIRGVRIEGHTDTRGSRTDNIDLSRRRAEAVLAYLVERGIDPQRLSAQGFGPDRPIADNDTAEGQAQNRRVEFHIIDND